MVKKIEKEEELKENEININGKKIVFMKQPVTYFLSLEKRFRRNKIGYCEEILKYPDGANLELNKYIEMPEKFEIDGIVLDTKGDLNIPYRIMSHLKDEEYDFISRAYMIAEEFLKIAKRNKHEEVLIAKYDTLEKLSELGMKVIEEMKTISYVDNIIRSFRSIK